MRSFEGRSPEQNPQDFLNPKEGLRERLRRMVPTFLEIRKRMGIGENIGLGSLLAVHGEGHSLGALPEITSTKEGKIRYSVPGLFVAPALEHEELSAEEARKNILVMPRSAKRDKLIVSIYDPREELDAEKEFAHLSDASDDLFAGIIAHELAHTYTAKTKFPPEVQDAMQKRRKKEFPDERGNWRYDGSEEETDLIAALFGYKKQVIEKNTFMIDRLKKHGPHLRGKERMLQLLERRKKQIIEYCP